MQQISYPIIYNFYGQSLNTSFAELQGIIICFWKLYNIMVAQACVGEIYPIVTAA